MAILHRLISPFGDGPGFLLPIFQSRRGANEQLVQMVDEHDNVTQFDRITTDSPSVLFEDAEEIATDLGRPSVWAFRDTHDEIVIGSAEAIRNYALSLVKSGSFREHPLLRYEIVSFCGMELSMPEVLIDTYGYLQSKSESRAKIWLDATVLLPVIRRDLLDSGVITRGDLSQVQAVTESGKTIVYIPPGSKDLMTELPRWQQLASIFKVENFELRRYRSRPPKSSPTVEPDWQLFAYGGVAYRTLQQSPFSARSPNSNRTHPPRIESRSRLATGSLPTLLAMVSSDHRDVAHLDKDSRSREFRCRHAVNIRPIGFGAESPAKVPVTSLQEMLPTFDGIWLISQHRKQQQAHSNYRGLAAAAIASRHARDAALGLIALSTSNLAHHLSPTEAEAPTLGICGSTIYRAQDEDQTILLRLVHNMLSNDAALHTAESITVLWPYGRHIEDEQLELQLGSHFYHMRIISADIDFRNKKVVGFAKGVRPSSGREDDFNEFCAAVMAGYGWNIRDHSGLFQLFEDQGEVLRIAPAGNAQTLQSLAAKVDSFDQLGDTIVTNQSLSRNRRNYFSEQGIRIVHFSELHEIMRREYSAGVLQDL